MEKENKKVEVKPFKKEEVDKILEDVDKKLEECSLNDGKLR